MKKRTISSLNDTEIISMAKRFCKELQKEDMFSEISEQEVLNALGFITDQHKKLEARDCSCNSYDLFRELFYTVILNKYEREDVVIFFKREDGYRNWLLILYLVRALFLKLEYRKDVKKKCDEFQRLNRMCERAKEIKVYPPTLYRETIEKLDAPSLEARKVLRWYYSELERCFEIELSPEEKEGERKLKEIMTRLGNNHK